MPKVKNSKCLLAAILVMLIPMVDFGTFFSEDTEVPNVNIKPKNVSLQFF